MRFQKWWRKLENNVEIAIKILNEGGVIIYPTETLYGLGSDIFNEWAVQKIFEIKGRSQTKAISIAVLKKDIKKYAEVNEIAHRLIEQYLPGPLTLVLRKKEVVPSWITKTNFVGIRVPENEVAQEILRKFGPITSTSANLSGEQAPTSTHEISEEIKNKVDFVMDFGETKYKGPSTVVKVNDRIEVLRKGVLDLFSNLSNT